MSIPTYMAAAIGRSIAPSLKIASSSSERDLVGMFGDPCVRYQGEVGMLAPKLLR